MKQKTRKELNKENDTILHWIKEWQSKNDYNPIALDEYNAKFKKEFNHFLKNGNFDKDTVSIFLVE